MTDTLHEIPDDELRRRIVQAENLLDRLYGEKFRRTREAPEDEPNPLQRRKNDTTLLNKLVGKVHYPFPKTTKGA